jgi:hypothetical protein
MGSLGKRAIGAIIGVALFIGIQEVRSRLHVSGSSDGPKVTEEDVNAYLEVMRATAERVKNPMPNDLATIDAFSRIPNARTAQADQLSDDQKDTIMRAIRLTGALDEIVAEQRHVDMGRYRDAKDAIESILPPPDDDHPGASAELTEPEKKALDSTRAKALAPDAQEIRELQTTIFNNPLRKTVKGS